MKLTDEQRNIVGWDDPSRVLLATAKAGTGKTTTAAELIKTHLDRGRRILALTFTRNGTSELASTLETAHSITFESKYGSLLNGIGIPLIIATFDSFLRQELKQLSVTEVHWRTADSIWVCERLHDHAGSVLCTAYPESFTRINLSIQLKQLCSSIALGKELLPSLRKTFDPIWAELAAEAARKEMLLPGGYAQLVLGHSGDIALRCLSAYDYLIVDECQDTSRHELGVLAKIATKMPIVCLGDPGQNLLAFRGALGDLEREFVGLGMPCQSTTLSVNQRSLKKLVIGQNSLQQSNGWQGPLATQARSPEGLEPLYIVGQSEDQLLDTLLLMLDTFTSQGQDLCSEVESSGVSELISDRKNLLIGVGALNSEREPSIVVLVSTNEVGRSLESALDARGVGIPFLQADFNPFDTPEAKLLLSWCDPEGGLLWTRISQVLEAHFWRPRRYSSPRAKLEIKIIFEALMKWCSGFSGEAGTRFSLAEALEACTNWLNEAECHENISTEQTHGYLDELRTVCQQWVKVHAESNFGRMLDVLSWVTLGTGASQRRSSQFAVMPKLEPWIFREARKAKIRPSEIFDWIQDRSLSAKLRPASTIQGVYPCIKTINRSKGDTVDVSVLYRADKVPHRESNDVFEVPQDPEEKKQIGLALEYVAASRARFVHIELALSKVGIHHEPRLPGWTYCVAKY